MTGNPLELWMVFHAIVLNIGEQGRPGDEVHLISLGVTLFLNTQIPDIETHFRDSFE